MITKRYEVTAPLHSTPTAPVTVAVAFFMKIHRAISHTFVVALSTDNHTYPGTW